MRITTDWPAWVDIVIILLILGWAASSVYVRWLEIKWHKYEMRRTLLAALQELVTKGKSGQPYNDPDNENPTI